MDARQRLVVHSVVFHQRALSDMIGTKCTLSFEMMDPGTAAGTVCFSYDQMGANRSCDHCTETPQAM